MDGAHFAITDSTITLQWAAVGTLNTNEAYQVTVEDITDGTGRKVVGIVQETKYIVPAVLPLHRKLPPYLPLVGQHGTPDRDG